MMTMMMVGDHHHEAPFPFILVSLISLFSKAADHAFHWSLLDGGGLVGQTY